MTPGAVRFRRHSMAAHQSWYRERVTAHGLKQRLARWLLMVCDRSDEDELPITQNLVAKCFRDWQSRTATDGIVSCTRSIRCCRVEAIPCHCHSVNPQIQKTRPPTEAAYEPVVLYDPHLVQWIRRP
jgi:hypothetical protein